MSCSKCSSNRWSCAASPSRAAADKGSSNWTPSQLPRPAGFPVVTRLNRKEDACEANRKKQKHEAHRNQDRQTELHPNAGSWGRFVPSADCFEALHAVDDERNPDDRNQAQGNVRNNQAEGIWHRNLASQVMLPVSSRPLTRHLPLFHSGGDTGVHSRIDRPLR